jgi:hypothetical protein
VPGSFVGELSKPAFCEIRGICNARRGEADLRKTEKPMAAQVSRKAGIYRFLRLPHCGMDRAGGRGQTSSMARKCSPKLAQLKAKLMQSKMRLHEKCHNSRPPWPLMTDPMAADEN